MALAFIGAQCVQVVAVGGRWRAAAQLVGVVGDEGGLAGGRGAQFTLELAE